MSGYTGKLESPIKEPRIFLCLSGLRLLYRSWALREQVVATAREYFDKSVFMQFGRTVSLTTADGELFDVRIEVVQDFDGGSKYLKVYIPAASAPEALLAHILTHADELIWKPESEVVVTAGLTGTTEQVSNLDLRFSGRVLVYTPNLTSPQQWLNLAAQMRENGLQLLVRDGEYAATREKYERPLAFISHDSRDKDPFVRELANKLASMLCPVWYDEFNLQPGDSLRENIERGLKTCPKCIIVLSKNFFSNPGWTKREFDTIYTREILEGKRYLIPIWLDVGKQDVFDYSPILLDTLGIPAILGVEEVARKVMAVLNYMPPENIRQKQ